MALCGATRSQLSPQFHCRYVFRARHSKILGVCRSRAITLSAPARHVFASRSPRWPRRRIPLGIRRGPSARFTEVFWTARLGGRSLKVEIGSDKSSANCIRAAQVRRLPTYRSVTRGESPLGLDRRETSED